MRYAFIDTNGLVVNVISGALTDDQVARFLSDYATLFMAATVVAVADDQPVWIGGTYVDGAFSAPLLPEVPAIPDETPAIPDEALAVLDEIVETPS